MMLSTLLQCCIVIAMQIKRTVDVVVVWENFELYSNLENNSRKMHALIG